MKDRIDNTAGERQPRLHLLGPVEITGTVGELAAGRSGQELRELIVAVYLNPGITTTRLARLLDRQARDVMALASRTRRWLGQNTCTAGGPRLTSGGQYELHGFTCDWTAFRRLTGQPSTQSGEVGQIDRKIAALDLISDRPLADIPDGRWAWADEWLEDTIDSVIDTAHTVAQHGLKTGDLDLARWATRHGRHADPYTEVLGRDELLIANQAGDRRRLLNTTARILETARTFGVGLDPETRKLFARLDGISGNSNGPDVTMGPEMRRTA